METKSIVVLDYGYLLEVEWEGDIADDEEYIKTILAMFPLSNLITWYHDSGYQGNIHLRIKEIAYEKNDDEPGWGVLELEEEEERIPREDRA